MNKNEVKNILGKCEIFNVENQKLLIENYFNTNLVSKITERSFIEKFYSKIHHIRRLKKYKEAEKKFKKKFPDIYQMQLSARLDGGLDGAYQFVRLNELYNLLNIFNPKSAIELGSGTSSAIFSKYFKDKNKFVSVEEDEYWLSRTKSAIGDFSKDVSFILAKRRIVDLFGESSCCYDIDHNQYYDLVYVDGPFAINPSKEVGPDGYTNILACVDVPIFWGNKIFPKYVVIDGRRASVRRMVLNNNSKYVSYIKSDYLYKRSTSVFRYHSIFIRQD